MLGVRRPVAAVGCPPRPPLDPPPPCDAPAHMSRAVATGVASATAAPAPHPPQSTGRLFSHVHCAPTLCRRLARLRPCGLLRALFSFGSSSHARVVSRRTPASWVMPLRIFSLWPGYEPLLSASVVRTPHPPPPPCPTLAPAPLRSPPPSRRLCPLPVPLFGPPPPCPMSSCAQYHIPPSPMSLPPALVMRRACSSTRYGVTWWERDRRQNSKRRHTRETVPKACVPLPGHGPRMRACRAEMPGGVAPLRTLS